jgi:putative SOS response-associated peptidase YedK
MSVDACIEQETIMRTATRIGHAGLQTGVTKFTAMAPWACIVSIDTPHRKSVFVGGKVDADILGSTVSKSRQMTMLPSSMVPVIIWDRLQGRRRVLKASWGFPHPVDWNKPHLIHARAESMETTSAFTSSFLNGQRGIVLTKSFCEKVNHNGSSLQHVIEPNAAITPIAFVWRTFEVGKTVFCACCMVTVPANQLIASLLVDRMPAIIGLEDWKVWLGEKPASVDEVKSCLKTVEGPNWATALEYNAFRPRRKKKTALNPERAFLHASAQV